MRKDNVVVLDLTPDPPFPDEKWCKVKKVGAADIGYYPIMYLQFEENFSMDILAFNFFSRGRSIWPFCSHFFKKGNGRIEIACPDKNQRLYFSRAERIHKKKKKKKNDV
jgi:hypothetical protein